MKGKKPGAGADKTERKTEKNEEKRGRRMERAAQVCWVGCTACGRRFALLMPAG